MYHERNRQIPLQLPVALLERLDMVAPAGTRNAFIVKAVESWVQRTERKQAKGA